MFLCFVFVVATSISGSAGTVCGKPAIPPDVEPPEFPNLIVNGKEALQHSWPWQVRLERNVDPDNDGWNWIGNCGGSIISPKHILTAAHCFDDDEDPNNWRVLINGHNVSKYSNDHTIGYVDKIDTHDDYDKTQSFPHHDIAIMTLKEPIELASYAIDICLTDKDFDVGKKCFTTGWGQTTQENTSQSVTLRQVEEFIFPSTLCQPYYYNLVELDTTMICAFNWQKGSGFCNGDSGGPLVCQADNGLWQLQGIVSFTHGCGRIPDVYTRVPHFYKWIKERIDTWK